MASDTQASNTPIPESEPRAVERKSPRRPPVVIIREGEELNPAQVALRGFCFGVGFASAVLVAGLFAYRVHTASEAA